VEDGFEKLPLHWMWWPALGGLAVGLVGLVEPRTMGVGYDNIDDILSGTLMPRVVLALCVLKFISWSLALGSGTSGGTLAPLFTFGGGLGAVLGAAAAGLAPSLGIDVRIAALVGMSAMFAGASRALLASVVFAFETTRQPIGLLPLLGGASAAFLVSSLLMRHSIMTEKIARRGVRALGEYEADHLDQLTLRDVAVRAVVTLRAASSLSEARAWLSSAQAPPHQGYPLVDEAGQVTGVLTQRDLRAELPGETPLQTLVRRPPVVIFDDCSLRDAADCMAREGLGRLPVVSREAPHPMVGIVTRTDLVHAHRGRLAAQHLGVRHE
jgi:CBS domain-containing protein